MVCGDEHADVHQKLVAGLVQLIQGVDEQRRASGRRPINRIIGTEFGSRFSVDAAKQLGGLTHLTSYKGSPLRDRSTRAERPMIALVDDWLSQPSTIAGIARFVASSLRGNIVGIFAISGYHFPPDLYLNNVRVPISTLTTVETIINNPGFDKITPDANRIRQDEQAFVRHKS